MPSHFPLKFTRRTVITGLFVLGIFVWAAIYVAAPHFQSCCRANILQADITTLVAGIRHHHKNKIINPPDGVYHSLNIRELMSLHIVPPTMMNKGELTSKWGPVSLFPVNKNMQSQAPFDLYVLGYTHLPTKECVKIVSWIMPHFHKVFIGNHPRPSLNGTPLPKDPSVIARQCAMNETVYVDFVGD